MKRVSSVQNFFRSGKKITAVNSWAPAKFVEHAEQETLCSQLCWYVSPTTSKWWNVLAWTCGILTTVFSVLHTTRGPWGNSGVMHIDWCDSRLTCAHTISTKALLVVAKVTAGMMYPVLAFIFATMTHSLTTWLGRTPQITMAKNGLFGTTHSREAHVRGATALAVLGLLHTLAHVSSLPLEEKIKLISFFLCENKN